MKHYPVSDETDSALSDRADCATGLWRVGFM